ncbi:subtilisin-like protein, partial [Cadophora sp. DSE1049]
MSPTSMVILMKEDATAAQYKDLVLNIPDPANHVEIFYEVVNFRVLIANVNDCDIKKLWENPIVETMSLEGPLILDDEADSVLSTVGTKREAVNVTLREYKHAARAGSNVTADLSGRALDPQVDFNTQANVPWHLRLLSGLSHQVGVGLNGLFYDFPGYLFADRSTTTDSPVSEVNIYLLDTGVRASHSDFAGRRITALDAINPTSIDPTDNQGHGTHMCSVSAGNYAGVAKAANIVSVRKNQFVESISRGIGMILDDVVRHKYQGRAVINMSFGSVVSSLYPNDLPQGAMGPQIDIIGAYLNRLFQKGIVVVCSAGNHGLFGIPLNDKTPRVHGGRNTPLIVVGATTSDENRWSGSQVIDPNNDGILSIYANGVDVVSASFMDDDLYTTATGTSEATAQTSGLIAYLLANDVLQAQFAANGLENVALAVKNHIRLLATNMKGIARTDPALGTPDTVPRLANGESIQCPTQNGIVNHPTYQFPPPGQEILPAAFPTILVAEGMDVVVPQNQL